MPGINGDHEQEHTRNISCCCFPCKRETRMSEVNATISNGVPDVASRKPEPSVYSVELPNDFGAGKAICITGKILDHCSRFAVDLTCEQSPDPDIAFHFNPRLTQGYVVRNSRIGGVWGTEETSSIQPFVFRCGRSFQLTVLVAEEKFLVSLGGRHICAYTFRLPVNKIRNVQVNGAVEVQGVEFTSPNFYPNRISDAALVIEPSEENQPEQLRTESDQQKLVLPILGLLPQGLEAGWELTIHGRVKVLPHSFCVNLQHGCHLWPQPTILFHFNPRFYSSTGAQNIVRNSFIDGKWGAEERISNVLFFPGTAFVLTIQRHAAMFCILVDDKVAGEFPLRADLSVDAVYMQGDIILKEILVRRIRPS